MKAERRYSYFTNDYILKRRKDYAKLIMSRGKKKRGKITKEELIEKIKKVRSS